MSYAKFIYLLVIRMLKKYHDNQYFNVSDIIISRDHCT